MKVLSFIACEDVRQEVGGKITLVGVYDGLTLQAERVQSWPTNIRVASHLRFVLEDGDPVPDGNTIRITYAGAEIADGSAPVVVASPNLPIALVSPMLLVPVARPGDVTYTYTFTSGGSAIGEPWTFRVPISINGAFPEPNDGVNE